MAPKTQRTRKSSDNPTSAAKFEQQIERLHRLLENEHSEVTWNDRLPDPDNPNQPRQIDVTIRRDGQLTLAECRIHKSKQGVKWIEELIGRRISLQADGVIAVSASGFTKGAVKKADRFGIILRSLYTLSEDEIRNWGKITKVTAVFYEFVDSTITFKLPAKIYNPEIKITVTQEDGAPVAWRGLFDLAMRQLDDNKDLDTQQIAMEVEIFSPFLVCGVKPSAVHFRSKIRRVSQDISLASVVAYAAANEDTPEKYAHVSRYDLEGFEILQNSDEVAIVVDTSTLVPLQNCLLRTVFMDFGREVLTRWVKPVGLHNILSHRANLQFRLVFS